MAAPTFDRVLWLQVCTWGVYVQAQFLRVVNGGYAIYYGNENAYYNATDQDVRSSHDGGNVLMDDRGLPVFSKAWHKTTNYGQWSWNAEKGGFERVMDTWTENNWIKIGDKYGWGGAQGFGSQDDLYYNYQAPYYTAGTITAVNSASFSNAVKIVNGTAAPVYVWSYPFTTVPSGGSSSIAVQRLFVHNGKFYGLRTDTTNGFYIYEYSGGNWVQRMVQSDPWNSALCSGQSGSASHAVIPYGGYFYVLLGHGATGSAEMVTCWKVDPVAWTATNVSSTFVPNGTGPSGVNWRQINPKGAAFPRLQEIPYIDGTGVLRYIIVQCWTVGSSNAGWSAAIFHDVPGDGKWADVCVGTELLHGAGGVIWDTDAGHDQIVNVVDHGTYVEIQHRCAHPNNKNIDVGIRYQTQDCNDNDGIPCTPYTGDPAHEGDTNLSTKPSTPAGLSALSDTFSGVFDSTKFMKCNAALDWVASAYGWYGLGGRLTNSCSPSRPQYPIVQQSGGVYFGTTPMPVDPNSGAALALRWMMTGDFRVDLTLDRMYPGVQNLLASPSSLFALFAVVLESANRGFGWIVCSTSGTNFLGTGLYFQESGSCVIKASPSVHYVADGNVMRIQRVAGAMSIINDQGGASEDITPATPPTLTDPVQLIFGAMARSGASTTWAGQVLGPGFSDLLISDASGGPGTGQIGRYKGSVTHKFMWDAMADLGAVNKAVNFLSYFKQNNP